MVEKIRAKSFLVLKMLFSQFRCLYYQAIKTRAQSVYQPDSFWPQEMTEFSGVWKIHAYCNMIFRWSWLSSHCLKIDSFKINFGKAVAFGLRLSLVLNLFFCCDVCIPLCVPMSRNPSLVLPFELGLILVSGQNSVVTLWLDPGYLSFQRSLCIGLFRLCG